VHRRSVHVIFEHAADLLPFGCSYIRDLLPLSHPTNEAHFTVTRGIDYVPAEIVVVERAWKPGLSVLEAEQLVARIRSDGCHLLYSIDDNLFDAPGVSQPSRIASRFFAREADGIIVSTAALRDRLNRLNSNVALVPNALDERLFFSGQRPAARTSSPTQVIGFMGTFTHDRDLLLVVQSLRAVLRSRPGSVALEIVGGLADPSILGLFDGLDVRVLKVPSAEVAYPAFVSWMRRNLTWDVAIAPLEETYFNGYKSDIKFLDYSALGVAGVYSAVPAYTSTVRDEVTGLLVPNSPDEWTRTVLRLLDDGALRRRLATAASEYVRTERTLEHCAAHWRSAIEELTHRGVAD